MELQPLENRIECSAITFEPEQLTFESATPVQEVRLIGQDFCDANRRGDEAPVPALLDGGASPNVMEHGKSAAAASGPICFYYLEWLGSFLSTQQCAASAG